ncbi:conjugative transposon protein TraM [Chryseobacterium gallinarum]|uniref:conjugative transposon protein TraM n=1 Tax=Chryseobacterium gallinarum TaxID=1324352 RepID=UPI00202411B3|nr:conjugative transposon protein TraM [Chryseobacterium gallinarum]MCL8537656.1 conjugative transposon protein TraM [Chryseobacterium gallinarum]
MEKEDKRTSIIISESPVDTGAKESRGFGDQRGISERWKKPLIFALMGLVFLMCLYLIFVGGFSDKNKGEQKKGLNDVVPEATEAGLQADKGKAYEQEMMEKKEREKKESLMALSDYWNTDNPEGGQGNESSTVQTNSRSGSSLPSVNGRNTIQQQPLNSYRDIQHTLGSFYSGSGNSAETETLRREIRELKNQLAEKDNQPATMDNQLAMMEKSYQLASKYFPTAPATLPAVDSVKDKTSSKKQERYIEAFFPSQKKVVSLLNRKTGDQAVTGSNAPRGVFFTAGGKRTTSQEHNSIRACVQQTQLVTQESPVTIRLLEDARLPRRTIRKGSQLTASAKFQGGRLQLTIVSIESEGNIIPVEINAYDVDGQLGLYIPYSPESNALTEIVANMGTNAGTNLSLTSNMGQQLTSDLTKSMVQGVSGYFAKRVRMPKVTLKAGHQMLLVSKK